MNSGSTDLSIIVKLKDEATSKLNQLGGAMETTFKIGAAAALAAGTAVAAFGISAIKSYAEAEASAARVNATLKAMGPIALANKDAILRAADAAVRLGYDDEAAAESITRFYQATGDLTKATKLNNIAMDLAAAKNLDLSTAANLVNQVLSGNGRVLKQYQINLKDSATPLEALGELQAKVAGQAAAAANTIQGKMRVLGETFSNLKDKIGKALYELGVGGLLDKAVLLMEKLGSIDFPGIFKKWKDSIMNFSSSFAETVGLVEGAQTVWASIVDFFNTFLKPSWDGLVKVIKENKDMLLELLGYFLKFIGVIGAGVILTALTALVIIFEGLAKAIESVKWFIDSLSEAFRDLATWVDKAFTTMSKFADKFGLTSLSKTLSGVGSSISGFFGGPRASGGPVSGGSSYLVGERGPEMFVPSGSGTIIPNGGGGVTINFSGSFFGTDQQTAEKFGNMIARTLGQQLKVRTI